MFALTLIVYLEMIFRILDQSGLTTKTSIKVHISKLKDMWEKIEEGPFFWISFHKIIYIFLKSLFLEPFNKIFLFVYFLFVVEIYFSEYVDTQKCHFFGQTPLNYFMTAKTEHFPYLFLKLTE
jgi:hypothetical protein